jgi:2,3-bisphosphoglycerate-independent phosphoglycerate mutase
MAPSPRSRPTTCARDVGRRGDRRLVAAIEAGYDLIVVNYANPDMVGHTGDLAAAIRACEAVDAAWPACCRRWRRRAGRCC